MKVQKIAIVIVSLFTASLANAQYYYGGPPGPPGPPPSGPPGPPWPAGMGPYFRMFVGPTFFQDSELKEFSIAGVNGPTGRVNYNVGVSGDVAFGWAFNQYVGLDFETGYTWGRMDSVQNYQVNNSDMGNVPFLANVTFSLPIPHTNIVPYIGGGAGGSDSIFNADYFTDTATGDPLNGNFADGSESDVVFAYQAFAGVRFMLSPNFSLGFGYRYFATGDPTFSYPPGPNLDIRFKGVQTHSIMFMLQASF
jgi:opacity protein-like surface antigen